MNDKDTKDTLDVIEKALVHRRTSSLYDAQFNADAEKWLRYLLSLHKQQQEVIEHQKLLLTRGGEGIGELTAENERLREEVQELRMEILSAADNSINIGIAALDITKELEQVKAESQKYINVVESIKQMVVDAIDSGDEEDEVWTPTLLRRIADECSQVLSRYTPTERGDSQDEQQGD